MDSSALWTTTTAVAAVSTIWYGYKLIQIGKRDPLLPPGPNTIPLLGNLHLFPTTDLHYQFTAWAKQYGDVYSLKMGPETAIVITSYAAVREIMEKNSGITASRPVHHIGSLASNGLNMGLVGYTDTWRSFRRAAHEILSPQACTRHLPIQQAEATQLMYDLLVHPEDFYTSIRRYSSSVILSVLFGKRAPQFSTPEVAAFFNMEHLFLEVTRLGAHPPVDLLPFLKRVPERFAKWKTLCKEVKRLQQDLFFGLLGDVEKRTLRGEGNGCYMETVCERAEEWGLDRTMIAYLGGTLMEGGSETTSSILQSLILALIAFPHVQKRAQEEVDRVVGSDRAPSLEDMENLPYLRAIIKEIHRFRPMLPLAIPHASTADVRYKEYLIPAGSTIFVNNWGIFHDRDAYEEPEVFNPERFLNNEFGTKKDFWISNSDRKNHLMFGTGRRICPGLHLGTNSLMINTVNLIWAFNFDRAKDPTTGAEIEPDTWDYSKGLAIYPNPFKCIITPRSQHHAEIIKKNFSEATQAFLPFEHELSEKDRAFVTEQRKML